MPYIDWSPAFLTSDDSSQDVTIWKKSKSGFQKNWCLRIENWHYIISSNKKQ